MVAEEVPGSRVERGREVRGRSGAHFGERGSRGWKEVQVSQGSEIGRLGFLGTPWAGGVGCTARGIRGVGFESHRRTTRTKVTVRSCTLRTLEDSSSALVSSRFSLRLLCLCISAFLCLRVSCEICFRRSPKPLIVSEKLALRNPASLRLRFFSTTNFNL